ncbi:MAG TPA: hypothetical protein VLK25_12255, partial [Allosphingosinicella sp.]|nr:hypothetical protein [Allosphingosinicella sp.]
MTAVDHAGFVATMRAAAAEIEAEKDWDWFFDGLPAPVLRRLLAEFFEWQAHGGQDEALAEAQDPGWTIWLLMAGRGFGKTLAGAHWVCDRARETPGARIALVGATVDEVVKVMIEGPSGLLAAARAEEEMLWLPTRGVVSFASGAKAFTQVFAETMGQARPDRYIATMSKARRKGRIFIDYLRNGRGATAVAPYSTRALPLATVST